MTYIKLEDGTICQTPYPDPIKVLTVEEAQQLIAEKEEQIKSIENEIAIMTQQKEALEAEILELTNLIQ